MQVVIDKDFATKIGTTVSQRKKSMAKQVNENELQTTWTLADIMRAYQKLRAAEMRLRDAKLMQQAAKQELAEAKRDLDEMMQQLVTELSSQE